MEVTDFRNDVILAEACRNDVEAYCKDTEPGNGGDNLSYLEYRISPQQRLSWFGTYPVNPNPSAPLPLVFSPLAPLLITTCPPPTPPGEGRVHQCLRFNKDKISERCRNEEMKLAAIEYRDIRLRPKLNKQCSEEKAVYCRVSDCVCDHARVSSLLLSAL